MAVKNDLPAHSYVCMMPRLRRVTHPHDERRAVRASRIRRALAKLVRAPHR